MNAAIVEVQNKINVWLSEDQIKQMVEMMKPQASHKVFGTRPSEGDRQSPQCSSSKQK